MNDRTDESRRKKKKTAQKWFTFYIFYNFNFLLAWVAGHSSSFLSSYTTCHVAWMHRRCNITCGLNVTVTIQSCHGALSDFFSDLTPLWSKIHYIDEQKNLGRVSEFQVLCAQSSNSTLSWYQYHTIFKIALNMSQNLYFRLGITRTSMCSFLAICWNVWCCRFFLGWK